MIRDRGTAMGDAIWQSIHNTTSLEATKPKKIIIISDGDNTAGIIPPETAIKLANSNHIKIFSIGIGYSGEVKFGTDLTGRPNMISNTFYDHDLKSMAAETSGRYYWVKTRQDLLNVLQEIVSLP